MSNSATPMNINQNHIIPLNMMNVNTVHQTMLGKRKGGRSGYERASKRTDLSMVADIGRMNANKVNIRLPQQVVKELKKINQISSTDRYEYAGKINFASGLNQVKFNLPNRATSYQRNRISGEITNLLKDYYITYHTHPAAILPANTINRMNVNTNSRSRYFTLPSGMDIEAYIKAYPGMQANIIADAHGYYVIDIIEATDRETRPNPTTVNRFIEWVKTRHFLKTRMRDVDGYEYFESSQKEWKNAINEELNPFMVKHFGLSIKYYSYGDVPALITLKRRK